ncbi:MAG: ATP-dependent DNA helicase RecG [Deltaproteobacteria bacterium]|nr:ATP-dependent DNA helicase RecG [Deltaproteobacteria bacterium]
MEKPLLFAAKNDCAYLHTVKGLNELIPRLAGRAYELTENPEYKKLFETLKNTFTSFYAIERELQKDVLLAALEALVKIKTQDGALVKTDPAASPGTRAADACELPAVSGNEARLLLSTPVEKIKGVGPKIAEALVRKDIRTIEDVLYHVPRSYIDRRRISKISELKPGEHATIIGKIMTARVGHLSGRARVFDLLISDGSGMLSAKWFNVNMPYAHMLKKKYCEGESVLLAGQTTQFKFRIEMHHPEIELMAEEDNPAANLSIVPVYPLTEGISQKTFQKISRQAVEQYAGLLPDYLPGPLRAKYRLAGLGESFARMHYPDNSDSFEDLVNFTTPWHRRIVFDEFFMLQLVLALRKRGMALEQGIAYEIPQEKLDSSISALPFSLTAAQHKALNDILEDMKKPSPMNRLVQGDVGSGKTVVAFIAAMAAVWNGYQSALMAPTEILAEQHFNTLQELSKKLRIHIVLLTGSQPKPARDRALSALRDGSAHLAIGTHALIQEAVEFQRLGLAIIDEQHRFGVLQRALIKKKGLSPDVLVMTATPIPRTLGLTVYGDLDISIIDELPPGRKPIVTKLFHEQKRDEVYKLVRTALDKGNQAFIVYPLVDESDKMDLRDATTMTAHLQQDIFPGCRVGLVHGKMPQQDKDAIMRDFKSGAINILVATTVIEVGIDVPNASLMIIEHAERFGLSQLHQLRGRVGRGAAQSMCILLAQYSKSDDARQRLEVMVKTNDGFKIAEEDFTIRGPGEFLGTRQSGIPDFRVAHIGRDIKILTEAREAAFALIDADPELKNPKHMMLRQILLERWRGRFELAGTG